MSADVPRDDWELRLGTTYLNHGSFGPSPLPVRQAQRKWQAAMDSQPMDFFVRQLEPAWIDARDQVAEFIGADKDSLALVENATVGMNVVASSFPLSDGDEVVLTDHEYGAVITTWQRACQAAGAEPPVMAEIPWPLHDVHEIVDAIFTSVTNRTRLIVVSHITSPTAIILPVTEIIAEAHRRGIAVCVDGPHAVAQLSLDLSKLGCDFYTASCHKWLCAPFGTGFLYVAEPFRDLMRPHVHSWGRVPPTAVAHWWESLMWLGTRDPSALLSLPDAIVYMSQTIGLDRFRRQTHSLAQAARTRLLDRWCTTAWHEDDPLWYGSMVSVPLPWGDAAGLQARLWERHQIEIPIIEFKNQRLLRVSCHMYNVQEDIDQLCKAVEQEILGEAIA